LFSYFYQAPLVKSSTEECEVVRTDGELIGSVQRYFNSTLHRIIDLLIGRNNLIVRVKAMDSESSMVIDAYTEMAMIKKPDYYIHFLSRDWKGTTFHAR